MADLPRLGFGLLDRACAKRLSGHDVAAVEPAVEIDIGATLAETSELLDVSPRKAAELSKELKDNFFDPERGAAPCQPGT